MNRKLQTKRLLVEGDADRQFFEALLREANFQKEEIWVGPPTEFGAGGRGKQNALHLIPDMIDEFKDGHVTHLGVVVDADSIGNNKQGFVATERTISELMSPSGYTRLQKTSAGILYSRKGFPPISVWIMPNNSDDGLIEDWIIQSIHPDERGLLDYARESVSKLDFPKFQGFHQSKAEVATWLAWQQIPGQQMASVIGNHLVNPNSPLVVALTQWLRSTFGK